MATTSETTVATPLEINTTTLQEILNATNLLPEPVAATTQATPVIAVSSAGVITATSTQTEGHVAAGTKTATKQLTTQAAKTITPSTSSQTAVESGVYTTGTVKVAAVPTQTKTATPTTSSQTISPDSGKFLSSVTVNAMPTATQATPSISVDSNGLITANAEQSAGYVGAGTKSATKQLSTQAAQTITPSTSEQTAVASGVYTTGEVKVAAIPSNYVEPTTTQDETIYTPTTSNQTIAAGTYCSGAQTIAGDADLVSANIKSGANIFGVSGSTSVVDTSDATAKVSDMVDGVTAYVNGEKVTGNVPEVASSNVLSTTYSYVDNFIDSTVMNVRGIVPSDTLCRSSSVVNVPVPASVFGGATAEDVAVGKTFTSAAGLKVTGTAETASIEVEELSLVNGGFYGDQNIVISHADTSGYYYNVTITTKKEIKELAGLSFKLYWKQTGYRIYLAAYSDSFAGFSLGVIGWMYDDSVYERNSNTGIIETDGAASQATVSFSGTTITISELTSYVLGEYYSQFDEYPDFTDGNWEIKGIVSYTT